jgi:hypothetical protein
MARKLENSSDESDVSDQFDQSPSDIGSDSEDDVEVPQRPPKRVQGLKHLMELKSTLELDEFKDKAEQKREKRRRQKQKQNLKRLESKSLTSSAASAEKIQTLATKLNPKAAKVAPEVIVYKDPRKKNASKDSKNPQTAADDDNTDELTMKQARFDVFKFGLRGLDKEGQHDARVALALRLGAKPEKKKCIHYADYKDKLSAEKEERIRQKEAEKTTGMKRVVARPMSIKKLNKKDKKSADGQTKKKKSKQTESIPLKMGKFDGGTLKLSKKDMAKMK